MAIEVITTTLKAASTYDLTTLAVVHDELSIPTSDASNDSFFSRAITQTSKAISNYCNRVFQAEGVEDRIYIEQDAYPWEVPGGVFPLQLSRWPLQASSSAVIAFTGDLVLGSAQVINLAITAPATIDKLQIGATISGIGIPAGTTIAAVDTVNNALTLSAVATAGGTTVALTTSMIVIQFTNINPSSVNDLVLGTNFKIDAARGWLINLNPFTGLAQKWPTFPLLVQYVGGFQSVPADVEEACLRLVTMRFKGRGRDPMLRSEGEPNIGTQQYWVGAIPGQDGSMPPEIAGILDNYRVPVNA